MTDQVPEQPSVREQPLLSAKRPKIIPRRESWLVSTLKASSLSVSRCNLNLLHEMPSSKLRLDGTPTPRSWVARMTKRLAPTGARQERLPYGGPIFRERCNASESFY
jgi:hypothetical protein